MTARELVEKSILAFEGADCNHPDDRGGLTRFGLTYRVFQEQQPGATVEAFRALTRDQVIDIITETYALQPGYYRIRDPLVLWAVVDFAINSGTFTATKALQRAVGAAADGVFGTQTEQAVNGADGALVFRRLMAQRIRFLGQIVRRYKTQAAFAGGWFDRVATIIEAA